MTRLRLLGEYTYMKINKTIKSAVTSSLLVTIAAWPGLVGAATLSLSNPLNTSDPNVLIAQVIKVFLGIVGAIALVFVIYGGFELLTSSGNQEKVKKGRETLMWATIGLVVVFGSYGIVRALFQAILGESIL